MMTTMLNSVRSETKQQKKTVPSWRNMKFWWTSSSSETIPLSIAFFLYSSRYVAAFWDFFLFCFYRCCCFFVVEWIAKNLHLHDCLEFELAEFFFVEYREEQNQLARNCWTIMKNTKMYSKERIVGMSVVHNNDRQLF